MMNQLIISQSYRTFCSTITYCRFIFLIRELRPIVISLDASNSGFVAVDSQEKWAPAYVGFPFLSQGQTSEVGRAVVQSRESGTTQTERFSFLIVFCVEGKTKFVSGNGHLRARTSWHKALPNLNTAWKDAKPRDPTKDVTVDCCSELAHGNIPLQQHFYNCIRVFFTMFYDQKLTPNIYFAVYVI